ncbi:MAG: hypothetical protein JNK87_09015 [Bryobacterales bacterium]|nr:hypothetical protein [Bryobacterales bacterium]
MEWTQGVTSKTGRRVLFGLLVCLNVGVQVVILREIAGRRLPWWCVGAASGVFVVWVLGMMGPWRPPEVDLTWWRGFGEVDADGFSGFGLPAGVVVPWDAVRRVTFTYAELVSPRYPVIAHRPQPTWARVETDDHTLWVPRSAFPARGWRVAARPRTASREEALLPPPDRAWNLMHAGGYRTGGERVSCGGRNWDCVEPRRGAASGVFAGLCGHGDGVETRVVPLGAVELHAAVVGSAGTDGRPRSAYGSVVGAAVGRVRDDRVRGEGSSPEAVEMKVVFGMLSAMNVVVLAGARSEVR